MRVLFLHQNAPGQFRHLAPYLASEAGNEVVFFGCGPRPEALAPSIRWRAYAPPGPAGRQTHHYLRRVEGSVRRGQAVARACLDLQRERWRPDVVVGHPGWGETMFVKDVLPDAALLSYCELFYRSEGQDAGFVPETDVDLNGRCRIRTWNADLLISLSAMDRGLAPTLWQRDQHPAALRPCIAVIHEGVDLDELAPDRDATYAVPGGPTFRRGDEVVTFVARHLEPVRGFNLFVRALPELLRRRPEAQVVICGGDGTSYSRRPLGHQSWREAMSQEVPLDPARVHFVGALARPDYLRLLQVSALHLYLSVPFVLSWSCVEALASGCLLLGSDVAPVREVIEDGANGFLVDARNRHLLAARAADLLAGRDGLAAVRAEARARASAQFDLRRCLLAQRRLIEELAA